MLAAVRVDEVFVEFDDSFAEFEAVVAPMVVEVL